MKYSQIIIVFFCFFQFAQAQIAPPVVYDRPPVVRQKSDPYKRYFTYKATLSGGFSQPVSTFTNYITKGSVGNIGINIDVDFPSQPYSAGVNIGQFSYYERIPRKMYSSSGQDISAIQTHTLSITEIMASGKFNLASVSAPIRPYLNGGVGVGFTNYTNYWGSISTGENSIKIIGQVGAGVRILFKKDGNWGIDLNANYKYIPYQYNDIKDASSLNARLGLFYRWW